MQVTQQMYVAEEWNKKNHLEARAAFCSRDEAEKSLGQLKEDYARLSGELADMTSQKKSLDAGIKNVEKQIEEQRKLLKATEANLKTERELVNGLRDELRKAKDSALYAEEKAQLAQEAVEAEKKAAYQLGVETATSQLLEQFSSVSRDYCDISWGKALDAAGVPADSDLRLPGSVYYDPDIRELPGTDPPALELPEASEPNLVGQAPPTLGASKEAGQPGDKGKPVDPATDKGQGSGKEKTPVEPKNKAPEVSDRAGQVADLELPPAEE